MYNRSNKMINTRNTEDLRRENARLEARIARQEREREALERRIREEMARQAREARLREEREERGRRGD